jgi:hypothetical protein
VPVESGAPGAIVESYAAIFSVALLDVQAAAAEFRRPKEFRFVDSGQSWCQDT